jgi:hypothetical protein
MTWSLLDHLRMHTLLDAPTNQIVKELRLGSTYSDWITNIEKFGKTLRENGRRSKRRGRLSDLIILEPPEVPRIIYRQVMPTKKAKTKK